MTVWGNKSSASVSSPTATTSSTSSSFPLVVSSSPHPPTNAAATGAGHNQAGGLVSPTSMMVQCFAGGGAGEHAGRHGSGHYYRRLEKVKFGVPVSEAFSNDIPATLLVLLLKVNKQGPMKKDIWRAPGNQAHVRKLIHVMQHGRLVNIENFSPYTAASVIKKFLTKIPGGIFGSGNEERLFEILSLDDKDKQREAFCRVVSSLPVPSQHLMVLLIGTFRLIADAAESCGMKTSPDAIGVSVAPSLFHSCILDGHRAKMEDIARFHMASKVLSLLVQSFGYTNLFPRENYEFYARITGRTLRVDENWRFTFQYPSNLVMTDTGEGGTNGEACCSSGAGGNRNAANSSAATNWLTEFLRSPAGVGGDATGLFNATGLNINRSRSSPARVNPYLGVCGELGGSWTELISLQPPRVPCGASSEATGVSGAGVGGGATTLKGGINNATAGQAMVVDECLSDMKASSCEF